MTTTTMNMIPVDAPQGDSRWKEIFVGVAYLMGIGVAFTAFVGVAAILFVK